MKRSSLYLLVTLVFCLIFIPMIQADGKATLTLDQAVAMAIENNSQVLTAGNNLQKSKLAVNQEVKKIFPQASVGSDYEYKYAIDKDTTSFSVTVTETIPTKMNLYGQKISTNIDVAILDQVNTEFQWQITQADVVNNVTSQYLTALKDAKIIQLDQTAYQNTQATEILALEQLRQGKITKPKFQSLEYFDKRFDPVE